MRGNRPPSRSRSPLRSRTGIMNGDRRGPSKERSSRNNFSQLSDKMVYLSNLPYEMTWMELKDIIREKAGEVTFVETLEDRDGKSKGCAVVEFKALDSAVKCVDVMHRQEIRGRQIVAKEIRDPTAFFRKVKEDTGIDFLGSGGRDRDRQTSAPARGRFPPPTRQLPTAADNETYGLSPAFLDQLNIKPPLVNRIFITNISFNCPVGRIFDVCALAGKVTWLDLQLDKDGKSKGMAVVQYSHPIEAVQAVSMLHDQRLFDRALSVKMDRFDKDPASDRREGELPVGLRAVGMGLGANGAPLADVASVISSLSTPAPQPHMNGSGLAPAMNPFGPTATAPAVNQFNTALAPQAPPPIQHQPPPMVQPNVYTSPGDHLGPGFHAPPPTHTSYGMAPIPQSAPAPGYNYGTPPQPLQQAPVSMPAAQQTNTPSHFFHSQPPPNAPMGAGAPGNMYGGGPPSQDFRANHVTPGGNAYGSNGPSQQRNYDSQASSRIMLIKNLPMDYTWQIVSDRVQQFGELESVEMISPGVAKVRFVTLSDAERTKATLQGTTVEGRVIGVEYL
ncbi:RNA recognition motif domain-containing protein [Ditylenchus destructor]|nr:RNA recognition motif domain-containing protein [Ditylenchus destructor]